MTMADFYTALGRRGQVRLRDLGQLITYQPGDVLYAQGDVGHFVVVLRAGHVKVLRHAASGRDTLLAIRSEGRALGVEEVINHGGPSRRRTTAEALGDAEGLLVEADRFVRFLNTEKTAWPALALELRRGLIEAEARTASMSADGARQRLAKALLALLPRGTGDLPRSGRTELDLTQADLAQLIGAARETVERALGEWRTRHIISTDYRSIIIWRTDELMRIAGYSPDMLPPVPAA